ncbi:MAG: uracil-DNA glycosylase [Gammaproteobacteria bacterium]
MALNKNVIHHSWQPWIDEALLTMDQEYLKGISQSNDWLPGPEKIFNAFSIPVDQVNYILLGESPYPRRESANGYAFWDNAVESLWSERGLSKKINRATSMRNIMKMLLLAEGKLCADDLSQTAIANCKKDQYIQTNQSLFESLLSKGFLLLNASLVLSNQNVRHDAKHWRPFITKMLSKLIEHNTNIKLLLFGKLAESIDHMDLPDSPRLIAEHPYNLSFITNKEVLRFFKPLQILRSA